MNVESPQNSVPFRIRPEVAAAVAFHVRRGDVVWVCFDPTVGSEVQKRRPALVVSADEQNANVRNPIVIVIPLTRLPTARSPRWDEVAMSAEQIGLRERSVTVTNQVRAIDRQRITGRVGRVPESVMTAVDRCLRSVLALV